MYCFQRACRLWFQVTRRWNFKRWFNFSVNVFEVRLKSGKAKVSLLIDFGQVKICISGKFRWCLIDHKSFNLQQLVPLQELYRFVVEVKTTKTVQIGLKFQTFHELYKILYNGYKTIWKSVSAVFSINTKQVNNRENQRKVTCTSIR